MILPIVAYGDPVLRKVSLAIDADYPDLEKLISNMKETMYNASGVGLAAPQIGKAIRLFLIDASPFAEDEDLSKKDSQNQNLVGGPPLRVVSSFKNHHTQQQNNDGVYYNGTTSIQ